MVRVSTFFVPSLIKYFQIFVQIFVENIFYTLRIHASVYLADSRNYFSTIILRFVSRCVVNFLKKKSGKQLSSSVASIKFPFLKKLHRFVSKRNEMEARFLHRKRTFGWKREKKGEGN